MLVLIRWLVIAGAINILKWELPSTVRLGFTGSALAAVETGHRSCAGRKGSALPWLGAGSLAERGRRLLMIFPMATTGNSCRPLPPAPRTSARG